MNLPSHRRPLAVHDLPDDCEIVVVGSGFGAAVTAARLAPRVARGDLVVLERGAEWLPGEFPNRLSDLRAAVRSRRNPLGLFDFSVGRDHDSLVASGLGGGSLIYANVLLEPRPEVFAASWPADTTSDALAPYFDRVRSVLRPQILTDSDDVAPGAAAIDPDALRGSPHGIDFDELDCHGRAARDRPPLAKAEALGLLGRARGAAPRKVPVAIRLTRPAAGDPSDRPLCTLCGNCVTGCNVGAKTTLWESYLPIAVQHGARLVTQTSVETVTPSARPGRRWRLRGTRWIRAGSRLTARPFEVHADVVVLGAGALGTTGILLRSAAGGLSVSPALGTRFSGNADSLAVSYNTRSRLSGFGAGDPHHPDVPIGPTISAAVDLREGAGGHLVQDGALPFGVAEAMRRILGARFALQRDSKVWCDLRAGGCPPGCGALEHSQVWLAMGADSSEGRIVLDRKGRPRVLWAHSGRQEVYAREARDLALLSSGAEAVHVENPRHALGGGGLPSSAPITVHPLGGAVMSDSASSGACDSSGRLYRGDGSVHDGLYVSDGALCPSSTGANPSLTIAAVAERNVERLIRDDLARLRGTA